MPERVDQKFSRRVFLVMSALTPAIVLAGCRSSETNSHALPESATRDDFNLIFDKLFDSARDQNDVAHSTRLGGPENGLLEIRFDGGNIKGTMFMEKGYHPGNLLGYYVKDDSARTIDLITKEDDKSSRTLVSTWGDQKALRFLPPEKYIDPNGPTVEPHKMTNKELGAYLTLVLASYNAVRLPPSNQ